MRRVQVVLKVLLLVSVVINFSYTYSSVDASKQNYEWDEYGYVLYCPCSGVFTVQSAKLLS